MTVTVSRNNHRNFIRFFLPVTFSATFSGAAMREVALALAGLSKERFIHFDNARKGIRVGFCAGAQKTVTPSQSSLQVNAYSGCRNPQGQAVSHASQVIKPFITVMQPGQRCSCNGIEGFVTAQVLTLIPLQAARAPPLDEMLITAVRA